MRIRSILLLVILFVLAGCGSNREITPTPAASPTVAPEETPTAEPPPTVTSTATTTPAETAPPPTTEELTARVVALVDELGSAGNVAWTASTTTHTETVFTYLGQVNQDSVEDSTITEEGRRLANGDAAVTRQVELTQVLRNAEWTNHLVANSETRRVGDATYMQVAFADEPEQPLAVPDGWIEIWSDLSLAYWPGLGDLSMDLMAARVSASADAQIVGRDADTFRRVMRTTLLEIDQEAVTLTDGAPGEAIHFDLGPYALVVFAEGVDFTEPVSRQLLAALKGPTVSFTLLLDARGRLVEWRSALSNEARDVDIDVDPAQRDEASASVSFSAATTATLRYDGDAAAITAPPLTAKYPAFVSSTPDAPAPFSTLDQFDRALGAAAASDTTSFWRQVDALGQMPLFFGDTAVFLYRAEASSVRWAGDWNGWQPGPGAQMGDSDIWAAAVPFPADARLEYRIVVDDAADWIVDPRNPLTQPGGFGPNSVVRMPDYVPSPWLAERAGVAPGTLTDDIPITSALLGYDVNYRIYTPAGDVPAGGYPVLYVTDGQDFLEFTRIRTILDNLIADGAIQPIMVVFIDPRDVGDGTNLRETQFLDNLLYQSFIVDELVPAVDGAYRTIPSRDARALAGVSYGGYFAASMALNHAETFSLFGLLSPSLWVDRSKIDAFDTPEAPIRIFLHTGRFADNLDDSRLLQTRLESVGIDHHYLETDEGHSYGNWEGVVDDMLIYFALSGES